MSENRALSPPSTWLLLLEGRATYELLAGYLSRPVLERVTPRGDGHPVLVLPGFIASGVSTRPLRRFLKDLGYQAHCWKQGRNLGLTDGLEERMRERVEDLWRAYGKKLSLVGWSLGGVYARELARELPHAVRTVITLGSPFGAPRANHSWQLYETLSGTRLDEIAAERLERMRQPPPVPATAIFSRTDGVTAWQCCVERPGPQTESIEVVGSHCGLGWNPLVYLAIADRLAQPEGRWRPFRRSGWRRHFYPRPRLRGAFGLESVAAPA